MPVPGTIEIVLPGTPRGKGRPRFGKGRAFTDPKTRAYERDLGWAAKIAMKGKKPLSGPLQATVRAWFPIPKSWPKIKQKLAQCGAVPHLTKPDGDNLMKIACDALNGIVYQDDKQIVSTHASKFYADVPRIEVVVEVYKEKFL